MPHIMPCYTHNMAGRILAVDSVTSLCPMHTSWLLCEDADLVLRTCLEHVRCERPRQGTRRLTRTTDTHEYSTGRHEYSTCMNVQHMWICNRQAWTFNRHEYSTDVNMQQAGVNIQQAWIFNRREYATGRREYSTRMNIQQAGMNIQHAWIFSRCEYATDVKCVSQLTTCGQRILTRSCIVGATPPKLSLPLGNPDPHLADGSMGHPSRHPKRHLDWF